MSRAIAMARPGTFGARPGGTVVLVGLPTQDIDCDLRSLLVGEKRLVGSFGGSCRPARDLARFADWHTGGGTSFSPIVTNRYDFEQVAVALTDLRRGCVPGRAVLTFSSRDQGA